MIAEAIEHQAPPGTFEVLSSVPNGRLGNSRTKRFVRVLIMPDVWPIVKDNPHLKDSMAVVEVRLRPDADANHDQSHFFGIDPEDRMTLLASWEGFRIDNFRPLDPLPAFALLKEIQTAQKLQPTLKSI